MLKNPVIHETAETRVQVISKPQVVLCNPGKAGRVSYPATESSVNKLRFRLGFVEKIMASQQWSLNPRTAYKRRLTLSRVSAEPVHTPLRTNVKCFSTSRTRSNSKLAFFSV